MMLKNTYAKTIQMVNGTEKEFVEKCWHALNMHVVYPAEEISEDAFLDWARDLCWIKQSHIVISIEGKIQQETKETIDFLNTYWKKKEKQVEFIFVD